MGLAVGYLPVFPLCSPPVWCDWGHTVWVSASPNGPLV